MDAETALVVIVVIVVDTTQRQSRMLKLLIPAVPIESHNEMINATEFGTNSYSGFTVGWTNKRDNCKTAGRSCYKVTYRSTRGAKLTDASNYGHVITLLCT